MTIRNTSSKIHPVRPDQLLQRQLPGASRSPSVPELGDGARAGTARRSTSRCPSPRAPCPRSPAAAPDHAPNLAVDDFGNYYTPVPTVRGAIVAQPRAAGRASTRCGCPGWWSPVGVSDVRQVSNSRTGYTADGADRNASIKFRNYRPPQGLASMSTPGASPTVGRRGRDRPARGRRAVARHLGLHRRRRTRRTAAWSSPSTPGTRGPTPPPTSSTSSSTSTRMATRTSPSYAVDDGLVFQGDSNGLMDALVIDLDTNDLVGRLRCHGRGQRHDPAAARAGQRLRPGRGRTGIVRLLGRELHHRVGVDPSSTRCTPATPDSGAQPQRPLRRLPSVAQHGYFKSLSAEQGDHHPAHREHLELPARTAARRAGWW